MLFIWYVYIILKNIVYVDGEIIGFNYNVLEKRYD